MLHRVVPALDKRVSVRHERCNVSNISTEISGYHTAVTGMGHGEKRLVSIVFINNTRY